MSSETLAMNNYGSHKQETHRFRTWKAAYLIQRNWILSIAGITLVIGAFVIAYLPDLSGLTVDELTAYNAENFMMPDQMNQALSHRTFISSTILGYLPIFYSVFFGATLVSRGRDTGAYKYTWTQAIGRQRINFAQIVIVAIPVALSALALSVLYQKIWNQELLRAGNFISPGYFPYTNWQYDEFTLQPAVFTTLTIACFLLAVLVGTLSRRMLVAMGLSFLIVFSSLIAYSAVYNKSLGLIANLTITNDPMQMFPETHQALVKAGLISDNPKVSPESYPYGSGFLDANGNFKDYDQADFAQFTKKDLASGQTTVYEGAEYKAITEKMKLKFGFRWIGKEDYPMFAATYSGIFGGLGLLLLGLNQLLIRRKA